MKEGIVRQILEGGDAITRLFQAFLEDQERLTGFSINTIKDDGLDPTFFKPNGKIRQDEEVRIIYGKELGSDIDCKIVIFGSDELNGLGPFIIT